MKKDFIIAFDIRDNKRLKIVSKFLEKEALRIQLSVFYIRTNKNEILQIINKLNTFIDKENDDVRVYLVDMKKSLFLQNSKNIKNLIA